MAASKATLHLLCGKIAAGKSTLAADLAAAPRSVLLCEDDWLARLYPDEISSLADYVRCAGRLRAAIGPHVVTLLRSGISVVLDFPANTPEFRRWMRGLFEDAGAAHQLHLLDVPDDICKARLRERNAAGNHAFAVSDAQYDQMMGHFSAPAADEGFTVVVHRA